MPPAMYVCVCVVCVCVYIHTCACVCAHLWQLDVAEHLHPLLALLLALQQLHLARDVAAVALCCHVLAQCLDCLPRNHLSVGRSLAVDVTWAP